MILVVLSLMLQIKADVPQMALLILLSPYQSGSICQLHFKNESEQDMQCVWKKLPARARGNHAGKENANYSTQMVLLFISDMQKNTTLKSKTFVALFLFMTSSKVAITTNYSVDQRYYTKKKKKA